MPASHLDQTCERLSSWKADIVDFAQELIRIPSRSGDEGPLAAAVAARMTELGLATWTDDAGNVMGLVRGAAPGRTTLLATHLDTADPGDLGLWERNPFGGDLESGFLHGLGAASSKAAIAAQVYAAAALARNTLPAGDLVVASVVSGERAGCLGMQVLLDHTLPARGLSPSFVILGDPTGLSLCLGHRGRVEIEISTLGRTSHSGAPWLGLNAICKMPPVLAGIEDLATALPSHPFLGKSTIAVTKLATFPEASGTIPDRCVAIVDRRYLPGESLDSVVGQLRSIVARRSAEDPEFRCEVGIRTHTERTCTGFERRISEVMAPWLLRDDHPLVVRAMAALGRADQDPAIDRWYFTTAGSYSAGALGIPTIGYSPGLERYARTPYDRVLAEDIPRAAIGTAAIVASLEDPVDAC